MGRIENRGDHRAARLGVPSCSARVKGLTVQEFVMSSDAASAASFVGSIPEHYDHGLGPILFADYAADIALRAAACNPAHVLETAAGTGIVTRKLRDLLPASVHLV